MPEPRIGFHNATFLWSADAETSSAKRRFTLKIEEELQFKKGTINLIVGPTGSGKTSLLMALLGKFAVPYFRVVLLLTSPGEMHFVLSAPGGWFNLPRDGGVAYAAQESWVQNDTIRVRNLSIFF